MIEISFVFKRGCKKVFFYSSFLRCGRNAPHTCFEPIAAESDIDMRGASGAPIGFDLRTCLLFFGYKRVVLLKLSNNSRYRRNLPVTQFRYVNKFVPLYSQKIFNRYIKFIG